MREQSAETITLTPRRFLRRVENGRRRARGWDWFVNVIGGSRDARHKASCAFLSFVSLCAPTNLWRADGVA